MRSLFISGKSQHFGNRFRSLHVIVFPHTRRHQVVKLFSLSRFAFPAHFNVLYESALHRAIYYCSSSHPVLFLSRAPRTLLSVGAMKIVIFFCLGFFPLKMLVWGLFSFFGNLVICENRVGWKEMSRELKEFFFLNVVAVGEKFLTFLLQPSPNSCNF